MTSLKVWLQKACSCRLYIYIYCIVYSSLGGNYGNSSPVAVGGGGNILINDPLGIGLFFRAFNAFKPIFMVLNALGRPIFYGT